MITLFSSQRGFKATAKIGNPCQGSVFGRSTEHRGAIVKIRASGVMSGGIRNGLKRKQYQRDGLDACWFSHMACDLSTIVLSARLSLVLDLRRVSGERSASESTRRRDGICVSHVVI